jgi:hypothetical protein
MFWHTKEAIMIIAREQAILNAQVELQDLVAFVAQAAQQGERIDMVERGLMKRLLALGLTLLHAFVAQHGEGDVGPTISEDDGHTIRRLKFPMNRGRSGEMV